MADVTITPAAVVPGPNAVYRKAEQAAANIAVGDVIYLNSSGKVDAFPSNTDLTGETILGMSLNKAEVDQPVNYIERDDNLTIDGPLVAGREYVLSNGNDGKIAPATDLIATDWGFNVGTALTTTTLNFKLRGFAQLDASAATGNVAVSTSAVFKSSSGMTKTGTAGPVSYTHLRAHET